MSKDKKEYSQACLDNVDYQILSRLQPNAHISNSALFRQVNLSEAPCWRRWKKLEDERYIKGYRAILDQRKLGFGVVVFTQASFASHDVELTDKFEELVCAFE